MFFIVGTIVVMACVMGGYLGVGGHLDVLWQPFEVVIICGAALGSFIIANPKEVITGALKSFGPLLRGSRYKKKAYIELLSLLYQVFRLAKTKGALVLEQHVENPKESTLFQEFPEFQKNHHAMTFLCDYLRLITLGTENAHEIEALMDEELETHHAEATRVSTAVQTVADSLPALGIVAAVLGVIHTMGLISEPPEILGKSIGGALVGTFLGVLLSYGFVSPMATSLRQTADAEHRYFVCIRAGLVAYVQGYAPAVAVEFARKALESPVRPTFYEVEEATQALPSVQG